MMMNEADLALAAAAMALLRSKRAALAQVQTLLRTPPAAGDRADLALLEAAGVGYGELNATLSQARGELERSVELGIEVLHYGSPRYPASLAACNDAPAVLFARGDLSALPPGVAVAGTRRATAHGMAIAQRLGATLAQAGWPVVGSLVPGIAVAALEGATQAGAPPVAVLPHGLEKSPPKALRQVADEVLARGGVWVSALSGAAAATSDSLVQAQHVEVGLVCASVVVEGAAQSAALELAERCVAQQRALYAVLPDDSAGVITQRALPELLVARHGASVIRSRDDYPRLLASLVQWQRPWRPAAAD
ncbi:DNA-processing protein DprA [Caldimonas brevitalea]|uniref:Smf/DprA SLOG domain-containing protein n=1 Tax=Caldimonas brevitalea TaxID=413882 RepID=A0A0G3BMG9_9BURK|nr:DNA-processing protein DprA [Caldimonas brevitalea]AKJ29178.1 hypothetical protein AAW51_2487 [Caldimonas brevitalea]